MANKNEVKALLARAGVEISDALKKVDNMSPNELLEVSKKVEGIEAAFFDFNGSCGSLSKTDLVAFFDFNGSCGSSLTHALDNAIKLRGRPGR